MLHEVPVSDDKSEDLLSSFETTCSFIGKFLISIIRYIVSLFYSQRDGLKTIVVNLLKRLMQNFMICFFKKVNSLKDKLSDMLLSYNWIFLKPSRKPLSLFQRDDKS